MLVVRPRLARAACAAGRSKRPGVSRGGAVQSPFPSSSSIPLAFHVRTVTFSTEKIEHQSAVFYKLIVGGIGSCFWDVTRRFSDFQQLSNRINGSTSVEIHAPFPPRHWFSFAVALTDGEERARFSGLEEWFSAVLAIATGECCRNDVTVLDANRIKVLLDEFLETNENLTTALKNTPAEDSIEDYIASIQGKLCDDNSNPTPLEEWGLSASESG